MIRSRKHSKVTFSAIATDLHSHLIPGLDDGSPSLEESLKMLKSFSSLGFKKLITSPHVANDYYPNTKERILGQMYNLQDAIEEHNIDIELIATAEYRLEPAFKVKLEANELIPFGKKNYILIEMPFYKPNYSLDDYLPDIWDAGLTPILVHPERYEYLTVEKLKSCKHPVPERPFDSAQGSGGVLLQLNLLSLVGRYGRVIQKTAEKLIKEGMVDFVGSDAHSTSDLEDLKKVWKNKWFLGLLEGGKLRNAELL